MELKSKLDIKGGDILTLSRDQCSLVDTGHIYWYILMWCCMVACVNILYPQNWLLAVGGSTGGRVGGFVLFTHFRPFRVDFAKKIHWKFLILGLPWWCHKVKFFSDNFFFKSTPNGLKHKKNTKPPTRPPVPPPTTDFVGRVC